MGISLGMGIPEIPARREIPEAREIPESREIPGRENFEAIREGGNGNFPLNITGVVVEPAFLTCVFASIFDPADEEICRLVGYRQGQHACCHIAT